MKKNYLTSTIAIILSTSALLMACGGSNTNEKKSLENKQQPVSVTLNSAEIEGLLFMREEEELARDLYLDIYAAKDNRLSTFKHISDNAEAKHAEAIRELLEKYGIEDPSTGQHDTYNDVELQHLYTDLLNIAVGSDDLAALRVGALVEETDIRDINARKDEVSKTHQDIITRYNNLLCGSRNHLRAFAGKIEAITAQTYQTQVPSLDTEVRAILTKDKEQCGEESNGKGDGNGKQKGKDNDKQDGKGKNEDKHSSK